MTYTHRPVTPATEAERIIAASIDPAPFARAETGRLDPEDGKRRSFAVRKARRAIAALAAAGLRIEGAR